jgi:diadenosine tetraphosphate (Ap4A) HIT family hydrolase
VTAAEFCSWPGYLILRLTGAERSLAELSDAEAAALGRVLARTARALERVTEAERVYLLSFAEVDRQLHFHLLPRTRLLAQCWATACGQSPMDAVDGPALFQWVRAACVTEADLPDGLPPREDVLAALRRELVPA